MSVSRKITIASALSDPKLLGAALGSLDTWQTWFATLKATFGLSLSDDERAAFASVAGGRLPPKEKVSELWAIVGRRGGKSRAAAAIAVYIAVFADHRHKLSPGEVGYVLSLSPSLPQAQLVFSYALAFLQSSPILKQKIESTTSTEIRLRGGIVIATHPNSFRTVRGRTLLACVFDESAFWRDETSASPDVEVYRAVLPALITTQGMLVGISSPYRRAGLLFTKYRDHFGKDGEVLVVQGSSRTFNPTLSEKIIDRAKANDAEGAKAEWDAEFREDLAALLDDESIERAIDHDRPLELPRLPGRRYAAFIDSSGGRHDHYTIAIGHREGDIKTGTFVCDVVRGTKPPLDPHIVTEEYVGLAKSYGCTRIIGDRYSGEWLAQAVADAGASYVTSDLSKSELYLEAVPAFSRGVVKMPAHPILIRELKLLERSVHKSGRDSVDHPRNGSDDYANSLAGCIQASLKPGYDTTYSWV